MLLTLDFVYSYNSTTKQSPQPRSCASLVFDLLLYFTSKNYVTLNNYDVYNPWSRVEGEPKTQCVMSMQMCVLRYIISKFDHHSCIINFSTRTKKEWT